MNRAEVAELMAEESADCAGCFNTFWLHELHPHDGEAWLCKGCYRNLLEGLIV